MNREIKFRCLVNDQMFYEGWNGDNYVDKKIIFGYGEDATIMQFTGLTDKNGVEIYEGDIVKQEKWVAVGKYQPCVGVIKYKAVQFCVECVGDWFGSNADLNSNAEIIGNIYENENLIKELKQ